MQLSFFRILFLIAICFQHLQAYERPEHVDEQIWNTVEPYFLPEDHPIKAKLDKIFYRERVTSTFKTLKKAGFKARQGRKWDNTIVLKHKAFKGYILKVYTDDQMGVNEWDPFYRRVTGAIAIAEAIIDHDWQHLFKVPNKWIYPLPESPAANPNFQRKNFILVAEDMHVLKTNGNEQRWFGPTMDGERLEALFVLIKEVGLVDSVFPDNVPFARDGRLAFLDTEHHHTWPIPYHRLMPFLSAEMQHLWLTLIANDGP